MIDKVVDFLLPCYVDNAVFCRMYDAVTCDASRARECGAHTDPQIEWRLPKEMGHGAERKRSSHLFFFFVGANINRLGHGRTATWTELLSRGLLNLTFPCRLSSIHFVKEIFTIFREKDRFGAAVHVFSSCHTID